jgi:hypothetical protein
MATVFLASQAIPPFSDHWSFNADAAILPTEETVMENPGG